MKKAIYICWGIFYVICAGCGFVPEPEGIVRYAMMGMGLIFFVPGFMLLYLGERKVIRLISAVSLGATLACMIFNFLSVHSTVGTGDFLYALLGLVSVPMFCSVVWVVSLFLWACLLMASFLKSPQK
jgi:hypothetical protein